MPSKFYNLDTDANFTSNSDYFVPSQKAIKTALERYSLKSELIAENIQYTKDDISNVKQALDQILNEEPTTINVGETTTVSSDQSASVTNSGTETAVILDFKIPQGPKGDTGEQGLKGDTGEQGPAGQDGSTLPADIVEITDLSSLATNTFYSLVPSSSSLVCNFPVVENPNVSNSIIIQADFSSQAVSVDWGSDCLFFDEVVPDLSTTGYYDIILIYSKPASKWVVKAIKVGRNA